jgi:hypothetical protein
MRDDEWKDNFKSYSMRTNFYLGLTRPQMEYLCSVADDVEWDRFQSGPQTPFNFIASEGALVKRGLIRRKKDGRGKWVTGNVFDITAVCELTPAGKLVVELLKITGLFIEQDNAIMRKAAKAVAMRKR